MGKNGEQIQVTRHAFLVAWGQFAQMKGLVERLASVKLRQKTRQHRPQTKVLEFLVAILGGARQLQDISLAAPGQRPGSGRSLGAGSLGRR